MRTPDERHFNGTSLWGDDFDAAEREEWFRDEEDAYLKLYASDPRYEYEYETVNRTFGFRFLPDGRRFRKVLGLGSAYGDELRPIAARIESAVIVESSDGYAGHRDLAFPIEWRKAHASGDLPLADAEVDLTVCLGVLHHIPNVSHVIKEVGRVTEAGGYALIREPIISMGDWRKTRPGLTTRERGIPRDLLLAYVDEAGFQVQQERLCFFAATRIIASILKVDPFNSQPIVHLDAMLSSITRFNYRYHSTRKWQKLRPTATFLTLRRR